MHFHENIGHLLFKDSVIRIILGEQSNGNHFVKTYYIDDRLTKEYREYRFSTTEHDSRLSVYTTRIDTVYGMSYVVMAPDHPNVADFITDAQRVDCDRYIAETKAKTDLDRTELNKEKTGVFTGSYVVNPFNGEQVPVWIADYVLGSYGTGAVMAVPAHDERDFEFAKKYDLKIVHVIAIPGIPNGKDEIAITYDRNGEIIGWSDMDSCFTQDGILFMR